MGGVATGVWSRVVAPLKREHKQDTETVQWDGKPGELMKNEERRARGVEERREQERGMIMLLAWRTEKEKENEEQRLSEERFSVIPFRSIRF